MLYCNAFLSLPLHLQPQAQVPALPADPFSPAPAGAATSTPSTAASRGKNGQRQRITNLAATTRAKAAEARAAAATATASGTGESAGTAAAAATGGTAPLRGAGSVWRFPLTAPIAAAGGQVNWGRGNWQQMQLRANPAAAAVAQGLPAPASAAIATARVLPTPAAAATGTAALASIPVAGAQAPMACLGFGWDDVLVKELAAQQRLPAGITGAADSVGGTRSLAGRLSSQSQQRLAASAAAVATGSEKQGVPYVPLTIAGVQAGANARAAWAEGGERGLARKGPKGMSPAWVPAGVNAQREGGELRSACGSGTFKQTATGAATAAAAAAAAGILGMPGTASIAAAGSHNAALSKQSAAWRVGSEQGCVGMGGVGIQRHDKAVGGASFSVAAGDGAACGIGGNASAAAADEDSLGLACGVAFLGVASAAAANEAAAEAGCVGYNVSAAYPGYLQTAAQLEPVLPVANTRSMGTASGERGYLVPLGPTLVQYTYVRRIDKHRKACNFTLPQSLMGLYFPGLKPGLMPGLKRQVQLQLQVRVPAPALEAAAMATGPRLVAACADTAMAAAGIDGEAGNTVDIAAAAAGEKSTVVGVMGRGAARAATVRGGRSWTGRVAAAEALAADLGMKPACVCSWLTAAAATASGNSFLPLLSGGALLGGVAGTAAVLKEVEVHCLLRADGKTWMISGAEQVLAALHGWRMVFFMKVGGVGWDASGAGRGGVRWGTVG